MGVTGDWRLINKEQRKIEQANRAVLAAVKGEDPNRCIDIVRSLLMHVDKVAALLAANPTIAQSDEGKALAELCREKRAAGLLDIEGWTHQIEIGKAEEAIRTEPDPVRRGTIARTILERLDWLEQRLASEARVASTTDTEAFSAEVAAIRSRMAPHLTNS